MSFSDTEILNRARLLLGDIAMERLASASVIIFGVGGVGSWAAECLVRTGLTHLTIVDSDCVCTSNINRQLMATTLTVGQPKVDALRNHLLTILPDAEITPQQREFNAETAGSFNLDAYDCIIDAIDAIPDKILLIDMATRTNALFYSSMGAALKTDPTRIRVAEFWKVNGCPLARALRQRFKKSGHAPARKFKCVFSDEPGANKGVNTMPGDIAGHGKVHVNGSLMQITAVFGLTLASLAINDLTSPTKN